MYRLHYEVNGGFWCIQFGRFFGLAWRTVKSQHEGPGDPVLKVLRFPTLESAKQHVEESGIAKHYRQQLPFESPSVSPAHVQHYHNHPTYAESNGRI